MDIVDHRVAGVRGGFYVPPARRVELSQPRPPVTFTPAEMRRIRVLSVLTGLALVGLLAVGPTGESGESTTPDTHIVQMTDRLADRAHFNPETGKWTWVVAKNSAGTVDEIDAVLDELLGNNYNPATRVALIDAMAEEADASTEALSGEFEVGQALPIPNRPDLLIMPTPEEFNKWTQNHN